MSAYIVNKTTIDKIISGMLARRQKLNYIKNIPTIPIGDLELSEFGQKLLNLNVAAVNQRYDEINEIPKHIFSKIPVTHTQALKSLRCLIYQCAEGDIPSTELYKQLDKLAYELAYLIVAESAAYDKAEWG